VFKTIFLLAGLCGAATISLSGVEIYSKESVHYGRWEFRMKAAATPGSISSFFTYYPDSYLDDPTPWSEIDIEVLGNKPTGFQSNLITGYASDQTTSETFHDNASDVSKAYHTYMLDWTPDSVVWKIDGLKVRKTDVSETVKHQVLDLRDSTETYRMNLWASSATDWVGKLDTTELPILQIVHWMRYSAYTPGAGDDGSDFSRSWVDSFKTVDKTRWSFGNWTFDKNYATFTSSNAKVQDGYLVMMLSTLANKGVFPATFAHDTDSAATGIERSSRGIPSGILRQTSNGVWTSALQSPALEAYDLRGQLLARGTATSFGQTIDLRAVPEGLTLVRQGSRSWRILHKD